MRSRIGVVLVVGVLAAAVLACGSGDGPSGLTNSTFEQVCDGQGVEEAAFYGSAADGEGPFPVVVFRRASTDSWWVLLGKDQLGADFPDGWISPQGTQTELVVCLTAIERELVTECYYTAVDDEEGGEVELVIELYNTKYEAVLRNAQTAEVYASTTFLAETGGICDEYAIEIIDQDVRVIDAEPGAGLVPFLEPWVVK
nr:hypothetical protein [Anaerolineae bacterium]